MTISTIRKFTDDDKTTLNSAATRFAKRHNIKLSADADESPYAVIDREVDYRHECKNDRSIFRAWAYAKCRALGVSNNVNISIAYGYVGTSVK